MNSLPAPCLLVALLVAPAACVLPANALGMSILRNYNQRDLDYDRDTEHGATQGARFP